VLLGCGCWLSLSGHSNVIKYNETLSQCSTLVSASAVLILLVKPFWMAPTKSHISFVLK